jgi:hypothetical protein
MSMTLLGYVMNEAGIEDQVMMISPFSVIQIFPDGSAMLYKNNMVSIDKINLSPTDIKFIKERL